MMLQVILIKSRNETILPKGIHFVRGPCIFILVTSFFVSRLREPDYEMYENGPTTPVPHNQLPHHHHHHHHSPMRIDGAPGEHPSYQNTAYTGSDAEPDGLTLSSAPSSAYYSDLSSNSANQQMPPPVLSTTTLTLNPQTLETQQYRLAAINETTVPSDYI